MHTMKREYDDDNLVWENYTLHVHSDCLHARHWAGAEGILG
jgi:hypothetical protein